MPKFRIPASVEVTFIVEVEAPTIETALSLFQDKAEDYIIPSELQLNFELDTLEVDHDAIDRAYSPRGMGGSGSNTDAGR
jgi:hypothetical protein